MRALLLALTCIVGCGSAEGSETSESDTGASTDDTSAVDTSIASDSSAEPETEAPGCSNGTRDGNETDVDCGGSCAKCGYARTCLLPADCASGACTDATCTCSTLDDCPDGQSCVAGSCVAAAASCAATKTAHPAAKDGEYWIKPASGAAYRAYCDMQRIAEICNEAGTTVTGRTREGSARTWTAKGKLIHDKGLCELWALAGPSNYPFDKLNPVLGQTLSTCEALGFVGDGTLGSCPYGTGRTNCGFSVTTMYRYGNVCSGCTLGNGNFKNYTQQGPMTSAAVLTNTSGTIKTTCKVR